MPSSRITGCSTGFGRVTTRRFLREGWRVIATVRRDADRTSLIDEARAAGSADRLTVIVADITKPGDVTRLRHAVAAAASGRLEMLVNNARTAYPGPLELLPLDDLRAQLEINLIAQLGVTQAVLPFLKAARGRIVNVSSISGRIASPGIGAYSASKFALGDEAKDALPDSGRDPMDGAGAAVSVGQVPGSADSARGGVVSRESLERKERGEGEADRDAGPWREEREHERGLAHRR